MKIQLIFLLFLLIIGTTSISHAQTPIEKCSWANQWCYEFTRIDLSKSIIQLGNFIEIKTDIQQLAKSTEKIGQIDVNLIITDPDNLQFKEFERKDTERNKTVNANFAFTPDKIGKYTVLLEITPPDRCCNHIFEIQNLEFEVVNISSDLNSEINIPDWIKNNAGWWAEGQIDDDSFVQGIQFLIKEEILKIPPTTQNLGSESNEIPDWIKNNAGWWAEGQIDDDSFVQGIQFLISNGIIVLSN